MTSRVVLGTVLTLAALALPASALAASGTTTQDAQQEAVEYAIEAGLMVPNTQGDVRADDLITRRELVTMTLRRIYPNRDFSRCFEWIAPSLPIKYTKLFSDVLITDPSAEAFCGAMVTGLISGQPDGSLRPEAQVTLAEAAKVITRGFGIYQFGRIDPPSMPWYVQYLDPLVEHDAVPASLSVQNPRQRLTRGQAAEIFAALEEVDVTPDFRPARAAAMIEAANPAPKTAVAAAQVEITAPASQKTTLPVAAEEPVSTPSRRQIVTDALLRQALAAALPRPVVVSL